MFSRVFTGSRRNSVQTRRNRTLSANLDPRKIPNRSNRPANRSFLNSMSRAGNAVRNSMHKTRRYVGSSINSMGLTRGARRRDRKRKSEIRYDILENEIVTTIKENSSQELKKELLRKLDEKLNFKTHYEEGYRPYSTCVRSEKNKTLLDDYIFVIGQLYFTYGETTKKILEEVRKEAEFRTSYCAPTDSRHMHY